MKSVDVNILASEFLKKASIKENMAKRIMFSLLAKLVPIGQEAQIALTKGMVDFQALKSLIPGAKELIEYGAKACESEAGYYFDDNIFNSLTQSLNSKDYKKALQTASKIFSDKYWSSYESGMYGGRAWLAISNTLLEIYERLEKYYEASKTSDYDLQAKILMEMVAYMNILDGLAHNTGSIMSKLLYQEEIEHDLVNSHEETMEAIKRLMDAKELKNYEDVLEEVLPVLTPTVQGKPVKQQGGLSDWIAKAKQTPRQTDPKRREKELIFIRKKKEFLSKLISFEPLMKIVNSFSLMPDSKIITEVNKYTLDILHFNEFIENFVINFSKKELGEHTVQYLQEFSDAIKDFLYNVSNKREDYSYTKQMTNETLDIYYMLKHIIEDLEFEE